MIDTLLSHLAPHLCCGCTKIGTLLCDNCKYNIISERTNVCISCSKPTGVSGVCGACKVPYTRAWFVGERTAELKKLIDDYKFEYVQGAHVPLSELLVNCVGQLPSQITVVPIPTVPSHIRQRGYDHALLLAKSFTRRQKVPLQPLLRRISTTKQRDASRELRMQQAKKAFRVAGKIDPTKVYLLIDDVITTGATLNSAAEKLREAGASEVWVAAVARQPLD